MSRSASARRSRWLGKAGLYASVLVLVSPAILVFLWMLSLSLKNEVDNTAFPPVFIPNPPTLDNFISVFEKNDFLSYAVNSVIVSFGATGLAVLLGVPAGYGIAKAKATRTALLILVARITPGLSYLIPLFLMFQWLGLTGTLTPLIITHLVITVPIVVWIMIGFFEGLPAELEEAALVDGATIWQAFRHVAMPLAPPGHHSGDHPGLHLQLEQLHLRRGAGGAYHPHPAGRGLQRADLRADQLGPAGRRRPAGDAAGAAADPADAEGDRSWVDCRWCEIRPA